jgi:hypothetical protein
MKLGKIAKIEVTFADGHTQTWEGEDGHVSIMTLSQRPPGASGGAMHVPYARQVQANITIPLADKGVLNDAEADPDLSV